MTAKLMARHPELRSAGLQRVGNTELEAKQAAKACNFTSIPASYPTSIDPASPRCASASLPERRLERTFANSSRSASGAAGEALGIAIPTPILVVCGLNRASDGPLPG